MIIKNKHSKRYKNIKNYIKDPLYSISDAVCLLKKLGTAKFIETIESHISLNLNSKNGYQQIRSIITLPYYNLSKSRKIAVLSHEINTSKFLKAGATIVGYDSLLADIRNNKITFDLLLTTPDLMAEVVKLGPILGPKGLMPSIKSGTITNNIEETISEYNKGKIELKADKFGIVHMPIGKVNLKEDFLIKNLLNIYSSINKIKPVNIKGQFIKSFYICTTMSPSIQIDLNSLYI